MGGICLPGKMLHGNQKVWGDWWFLVSMEKAKAITMEIFENEYNQAPIMMERKEFWAFSMENKCNQTHP